MAVRAGPAGIQSDAQVTESALLQGCACGFASSASAANGLQSEAGPSIPGRAASGCWESLKTRFYGAGCLGLCAKVSTLRSQRRRPNRSPLPLVLPPRPKRSMPPPPPGLRPRGGQARGRVPLLQAGTPLHAKGRPPAAGWQGGCHLTPSKLILRLWARRASRLPLRPPPPRAAAWPGSGRAGPPSRTHGGYSRRPLASSAATSKGPHDQGNTAGLPRRGSPFLGRRHCCWGASFRARIDHQGAESPWAWTCGR